MKLESLVKQFADSVKNQNDAVAKGDVRKGNEFAKIRSDIFDQIRFHGDEGREALTSLFTHERADVRIMAAAFLLRYCEDRARAVLEAEAKGPGLVAFGAGQALQRWTEGTWELDPA